MTASPAMIEEQNAELLVENMKLKSNKDFFKGEAERWRKLAQDSDRDSDREQDVYLKCIRTIHNSIAQLDLDISNITL